MNAFSRVFFFLPPLHARQEYSKHAAVHQPCKRWFQAVFFFFPPFFERPSARDEFPTFFLSLLRPMHLSGTTCTEGRGAKTHLHPARGFSLTSQWREEGRAFAHAKQSEEEEKRRNPTQTRRGFRSFSLSPPNGGNSSLASFPAFSSDRKRRMERGEEEEEEDIGLFLSFPPLRPLLLLFLPKATRATFPQQRKFNEDAPILLSSCPFPSAAARPEWNLLPLSPPRPPFPHFFGNIFSSLMYIRTRDDQRHPPTFEGQNGIAAEDMA